MESGDSEQYIAIEHEYHIELIIPSKEVELKSNSSQLEKITALTIADTHCFEERMTLSPANLLLVAGDFTCNGAYEELQDFSDFLSKEKSKFDKIIITPGIFLIIKKFNTIKLKIIFIL